MKKLFNVLTSKKKNEAEHVACEQTLAQCFDLRNAVMDVVYPFKGVTPENYAESLKKHVGSQAAGHFDKFEAFLGDKPFFAGEEPTAGDFHVWEMIDQHEMMTKAQGLPSMLETRPKLKAFYERFKALEKLVPYFASPAAKFPVNNKMANFK